MVTKIIPRVLFKKKTKKTLSLCVTSPFVRILPSSLHLITFTQVPASCIEFLSRRSHKLPATLGLNSKETSIKSQASWRSSV